MTYQEAANYFTMIEEIAKYQPKLKNYLIKLRDAAIKYSAIRVKWQISGSMEKYEMDSHRTNLHNNFIACCDNLSKKMLGMNFDNSWRDEIGNDRKDVGDFACYIICILAIRAR